MPSSGDAWGSGGRQRSTRGSVRGVWVGRGTVPWSAVPIKSAVPERSAGAQCRSRARVPMNAAPRERRATVSTETRNTETRSVVPKSEVPLSVVPLSARLGSEVPARARYFKRAMSSGATACRTQSSRSE